MRILVLGSRLPCHGFAVRLERVQVGDTVRRQCKCKKRWLVEVRQSEVPTPNLDLRRAWWTEDK